MHIRTVSGPVTGVLLRPQVRYVAHVGDVAYGSIPRDVLIQTLTSGRLAAILIEKDIAARFAIATGTQGAGADLIDPNLGAIQLKTYRGTRDAVFASGPRAGRRKAAQPSVWTTKSGFWDRRNSLTALQRAQAAEYLRVYDHFCYVDIAALADLTYSFVVVPSAQVVAASDGFLISEDAILQHVSDTITLPPPH